MLISKSKKIKEISLPEYNGDRVYMHPFEISNPVMPSGYERWSNIVNEMISHSPKKEGTAYLTIDEKELNQGETHRRGGPHTDGNFLYDWGGGGGGGGWLTGGDGRYLPKDKHLEQYCANKGGMLIVSSYVSCKGWNGSFIGNPDQGGNCESIDLSNLESFLLEKNTLYWGNITFIHESLPVEKSIKRQLIRITLPSDSEDIK